MTIGVSSVRNSTVRRTAAVRRCSPLKVKASSESPQPRKSPPNSPVHEHSYSRCDFETATLYLEDLLMAKIHDESEKSVTIKAEAIVEDLKHLSPVKEIMLKAYSTRLAQKNSSLKIEKKTKLVKTIKKTRTNSKFKIKSEKKSIKIEVKPNHLVTDFFPIRRSKRTTYKTLKKERDITIENCLRTGCQDGLLVKDIENKGRGIVASKQFKKGDFVVEYKGERINLIEAKKRESNYLSVGSGCYMYYFRLADKSYCIDATDESPYYGRLLNHARQNPNCITKSLLLDCSPRLVLIAGRDISSGEELTYDYGDHDPSVMKSHPWLAY